MADFKPMVTQISLVKTKGSPNKTTHGCGKGTYKEEGDNRVRRR